MIDLRSKIEEGKLLAEKGDYEKARLCFNKVLEISPEDEETLFEMGKIHYILKEYRIAAQMLESILHKGSRNIYAASG